MFYNDPELAKLRSLQGEIINYLSCFEKNYQQDISELKRYIDDKLKYEKEVIIYESVECLRNNNADTSKDYSEFQSCINNKLETMEQYVVDFKMEVINKFEKRLLDHENQMQQLQSQMDAFKKLIETMRNPNLYIVEDFVDNVK